MAPTSVVAADKDALAYVRTVAEVKRIVYLSNNATLPAGAGFFPAGQCLFACGKVAGPVCQTALMWVFSSGMSQFCIPQVSFVSSDEALMSDIRLHF